MSCSYGPGRYDVNYEEYRQDYPYGYVRWTEKRNIEAIVDLIRRKKIKASDYIAGEIPFDKILKNYQNLKGKSVYENNLIKYCDEPNPSRLIDFKKLDFEKKAIDAGSQIDACFVGTGAYASKVLAKAAVKAGFKIHSAASRNGLSAWKFGRKFEIVTTTSDIEHVLTNEKFNDVFITTRHNSHYKLVMDALNGGKSIWCEKPLCLSMNELHGVAKLSEATGRNVYVGFNRRRSTHIKF